MLACLEELNTVSATKDATGTDGGFGEEDGLIVELEPDDKHVVVVGLVVSCSSIE